LLLLLLLLRFSFCLLACFASQLHIAAAVQMSRFCVAGVLRERNDRALETLAL